VPNWLTYRFGSLPDNTAASGANAISVPAGGSASRTLNLTASLTAPTGTYSITVKGWVEGSPEQRISLELTVQPPAGFGMAQFTMSPSFGQVDQVVNFSGSGFYDCLPSQVTESAHHHSTHRRRFRRQAFRHVPGTRPPSGHLLGQPHCGDLPQRHNYHRVIHYKRR
jgi:hypothetical protein